MSSDPIMTDQSHFDEVLGKLNMTIGTLKDMTSQIRALKKDFSKLEKNSKKRVKSEKDPNKPTPFSKPLKVSDELQKFLNIKEDISRTEVTKMMYSYIKGKNLQNQEKKREYILDKDLAKLFNLKEGDSMEYFKMQTHMKKHYPEKQQ